MFASLHCVAVTLPARNAALRGCQSILVPAATSPAASNGDAVVPVPKMPFEMKIPPLRNSKPPAPTPPVRPAVPERTPPGMMRLLFAAAFAAFVVHGTVVPEVAGAVKVTSAFAMLVRAKADAATMAAMFAADVFFISVFWNLNLRKFGNGCCRFLAIGAWCLLRVVFFLVV